MQLLKLIKGLRYRKSQKGIAARQTWPKKPPLPSELSNEGRTKSIRVCIVHTEYILSTASTRLDLIDILIAYSQSSIYIFTTFSAAASETHIVSYRFMTHSHCFISIYDPFCHISISLYRHALRPFCGLPECNQLSVEKCSLS